jgi:Zn-dependent membrane protease YugP
MYLILYFVVLSPALLLMIWAHDQVQSTFSDAEKVPTRLSGSQAARQILDAAGLESVAIESVAGKLSDHYDPQQRVLRLSNEVYSGQNAGAVGIAAHEAGHALQHAQNSAPWVAWWVTAPAAQSGPLTFLVLLLFGIMAMCLFPQLLLIGIAVGGLHGIATVAILGVAAVQYVNIRVEFDASHRARRLLAEKGIVDDAGAAAVSHVLNAAAWTYVAGMLQAILSVLFWIIVVFVTILSAALSTRRK